MNPSSKRGFHVILVLFKVLTSLLLRILGLGRNPNKTLGFWEQTNNYAIVWKTISSFKSPCSSIPFWSSIFFLFSSSLFFSSSFFSFLLLLFSLSLRFSLYLETKFVFKPMFVKAMFGQVNKTHFWLNFLYLHLIP